MAMRTTHVTFPRHVIKVRGFYRCKSCNKRFTRSDDDDWTENPFHNWRGREAELDQETIDACKTRLQERAVCPSECDGAIELLKHETSVEVR